MIELGQQLLAASVGVRIELGRILGEGGQARADRTLGEALRLQQRIKSGGQVGDLGQADLVRLVGAEVGRGVEAQGVGVEVAALGQARHGGVVDGGPAVFGEQGDLLSQAGGHGAIDDGGGAGRPVGPQTLGGGAPTQRGGEARGLALLPRQRPELSQRLVEDEVGRDHAAGGVGLGAGGLVAQRLGEVGKAGEIGLTVSLGLDDVLGVEPVGNLLIGSGELAQHIGHRVVVGIDADIGEGRGLGAAVGIPGDRLVLIDAAPGQAAARNGAKLGAGVDQRLEGSQPAGGRAVSDPRLEGRARPLVEAQARGVERIGDEHALEDLVIDLQRLGEFRRHHLTIGGLGAAQQAKTCDAGGRGEQVAAIEHVELPLQDRGKSA